MADITSGFNGRHLEFRSRSLNRDAIFTVKNLLLLQGFSGRHLEFRQLANVGAISGVLRDVSSMVANVWVAVRIVSPAHCVQ